MYHIGSSGIREWRLWVLRLITGDHFVVRKCLESLFWGLADACIAKPLVFEPVHPSSCIPTDTYRTILETLTTHIVSCQRPALLSIATVPLT